MPMVECLLPEVTCYLLPFHWPIRVSWLCLIPWCRKVRGGGADTQVTLQSLRNDGSEGSLVLHTEALVLVPGSLGQLSPPGGERTIILILPRMKPKIFNMAEEEKLSFSHPVY